MVDIVLNEPKPEPNNVTCIFCETEFPIMLTVETIFYNKPVRICRTCNDELHTCAHCGEKVLKTEGQLRGSNGEYYHIDCV